MDNKIKHSSGECDPSRDAWGYCVWCGAPSTTTNSRCSAPDGDGHLFNPFGKPKKNLLPSEPQDSSFNDAETPTPGVWWPPDHPPKGSFQYELEKLINSHSAENGSDTPDFILAEYLQQCLNVFNKAIYHREKWYGRDGLPVPSTIEDPICPTQDNKTCESD